MKVLSVDLAFTAYDRFGIVLLEQDHETIWVRRLTPADLGLSSATPDPLEVATQLREACGRLSVSTLILDGPQAWKDPDNGLQHCRVCEQRLNTPGKTGLPGHAKPRNYLPFIAFSVATFKHLVALGFELWSGQSPPPLLALESFPRSAWGHLGLTPLPAKSKSRREDLQRAADALHQLFPLRIQGPLSHDETQALVAAPAGIAVTRGWQPGYTTAGASPKLLDDTWYEGFIVNPTREALAPCA
jgi:hypothetical protein